MDTKHFVYVTKNLINGNIYVGVHSTQDINDGYLGSGVIIKQAIAKYGLENFRRDILVFTESREAAFEIEEIIVDTNFIARDDVYNITEGGRGVSTHSEDGLQRLIEAATDKVVAWDYIIEKKVKISKQEFDNNPERYVGHTVGKRVMRNSQGDIIVTEDRDDEDLVGVTKGKKKVYDENGKVILADVNDQRIVDGIYIPYGKGKTPARDKNNNIIQASVDDPGWANGELVGLMKGATYKHKQKRKELTCPDCGKTGDSSNMRRWHKCPGMTKI